MPVLALGERYSGAVGHRAGLEYDPATGATRVVAGGLSFANGVTLSQDEQTLFMSETGQHKV
jgi:sugar lactone lactonase YvrE